MIHLQRLALSASTIQAKLVDIIAEIEELESQMLGLGLGIIENDSEDVPEPTTGFNFVTNNGNQVTNNGNPVIVAR